MEESPRAEALGDSGIGGSASVGALPNRGQQVKQRASLMLAGASLAPVARLRPGVVYVITH